MRLLPAARNLRPNFWVIEWAARVAIRRHGNRPASAWRTVDVLPPHSYRADRSAVSQAQHAAAFAPSDAEDPDVWSRRCHPFRRGSANPAKLDDDAVARPAAIPC